MRISEWSSDVCSSDLVAGIRAGALVDHLESGLEHLRALRRLDLVGIDALRKRRVQLLADDVGDRAPAVGAVDQALRLQQFIALRQPDETGDQRVAVRAAGVAAAVGRHGDHLRGFGQRSEEHTSELQSLLSISYAVFCLKNKNTN